MRRWIPLLLAFLSSAAFAQATVSGPATAKVGAAGPNHGDGLEEPAGLRDDRGEERAARAHTAAMNM